MLAPISNSNVIVSLVACESLIWEKDKDIPSAIRVLSAIQITPLASTVHFTTLTILYNPSLDFLPHTLQLHVTAPDLKRIASALPYRFVYGYKLSQADPGGFMLSTAFILEVKQLGTHWIQAYLDGELKMQIPIFIQRK